MHDVHVDTNSNLIFKKITLQHGKELNFVGILDSTRVLSSYFCFCSINREEEKIKRKV